MDENTSVDGTRYDMTKNYFIGIQRAGGLPFGIPYFAEMVDSVVAEFDGFVSVGGRIKFPRRMVRSRRRIAVSVLGAARGRAGAHAGLSRS